MVPGGASHRSPEGAVPDNATRTVQSSAGTYVEVSFPLYCISVTGSGSVESRVDYLRTLAST